MYTVKILSCNWNLIINFEIFNKTKMKPCMNCNQYENKSSSRCCTAEHYQNEHIKTQSNFAFKSIKFISINSAIEEQKIYISMRLLNLSHIFPEYAAAADVFINASTGEIGQ